MDKRTSFEISKTKNEGKEVFISYLFYILLIDIASQGKDVQ